MGKFFKTATYDKTAGVYAAVYKLLKPVFNATKNVRNTKHMLASQQKATNTAPKIMELSKTYGQKAVDDAIMRITPGQMKDMIGTKKGKALMRLQMQYALRGDPTGKFMKMLQNNPMGKPDMAHDLAKHVGIKPQKWITD